MAATGIKPMTSTVSSTMKPKPDQGFSGYGAQKSAKPRKKIEIPHPGHTLKRQVVAEASSEEVMEHLAGLE